MSKKKIILIILIGILILLCFITGIKTIKNFIILQKVFSKVEENIEKDNYYLKIITKTTENDKTNETITEAYYRNGIGKLNPGTGIFTWTNGKEAYVVDNEKMQLKEMEIENSKLLVSSDMFAYIIPSYTDNILEKFIFAGNFNNSISSKKLDGEPCYIIKQKTEDSTKKVWIEKKSGKPVKATIEMENGINIEHIYNLSFTATKLISVELDKNKYTIINKNNEVLSEPTQNNQTQNNIENNANTTN